MNTRTTAALMFLVPAFALAQTPVDDNGNVVSHYESQADIMSIGDGAPPLLSHADLQELVGPIALYPDDLLAIVLPASAYPLQIVEAARFLKALESDPGLTPDEDWDDAVVALLNYPEILALLNEDLDWTLQLGDAVVAQQADVVAAVESFRDRAYAAGNLKSDEYQTISDDDGVITISPVSEDVIYVPYYEPAKVVYYQPEPVYYYYPRPYPVYYYPYASNYSFRYGYFWGVTTAFSMGWYTDSLYVYHNSYYGHPYYGHTYWNQWYYRRPSINVYNNYYVNDYHGQGDRYSHGDHWQARESRREYVRREGYTRNENHDGERRQSYGEKRGPRVPVSFRERDAQQVNRNTTTRVPSTRNSGSSANVANQSRDVSRQNLVGQSREGQRQDVTAQSRNTQRSARTERSSGENLSQQLNASARDTRRRQTTTVTETRDTQQRTANTSQARDTQPRYTGISQNRNTQQRSTNTQQRSTNVAQARDTQPRTTVAPAAVTPVRNTRRQEAVQHSNRPAPARTERAPAPQQNRASYSPPPRTQPSSSSPPRSQERSSSAPSDRSGSNARQSRSAERSRR